MNRYLPVKPQFDNLIPLPRKPALIEAETIAATGINPDKILASITKIVAATNIINHWWNQR